VSYTEARSHFENAKNNTADPAIIEIANGLKHLTHAVEEHIRTLEQDIRDSRIGRQEPESSIFNRGSV
jgi:hypothetical protein